MKIKVKYRVDQRIKIAEIRTGTIAFIVGLEDFSQLSGIRDFTESSTGETSIPIENYKELKGDRITDAKPHSFRFRRVKAESGDSQET